MPPGGELLVWPQGTEAPNVCLEVVAGQYGPNVVAGECGLTTDLTDAQWAALHPPVPAPNPRRKRNRQATLHIVAINEWLRPGAWNTVWGLCDTEA